MARKSCVWVGFNVALSSVGHNIIFKWKSAVYWACLGISFLFSVLSFVGAGFALIAAAGVVVFRQFLDLKIKFWKAVLLVAMPFVGQGFGAMAFAFVPGF